MAHRTWSSIPSSHAADPAIGTSACDTGSSPTAGGELDAGTGTNFTSDFHLAVSSAVMGGLLGDAGAIYFANLAGDVARVGTPRIATAGHDPPAGHQPVGGHVGVHPMGWRVVP